jgi:predicted permease
VPRADEIGLDARALGFALVVALAAGVLAALVPALGAARLDVRAALAGGARGSTAGLGRRRSLERLVVAQVALGVVLAAGAGLLAASLARLRAVDPGFVAERVTIAEVPLPPRAPGRRAAAGPGAPNGQGDEAAARARAFYDALLARARALPGVEAAALATAVPFGNTPNVGVMDVEAHPRAEGDPWKTVAYTGVTPGAARALGIPLLAGRDVSDADRAGAPLVGLVDAAAARRYWPEFADVRRVIGQRVRRPNDDAPWVTIVGVVGSVRRDSLAAEPDPSIYLPLAQDYPGDVRVVLRGSATDAQLAPALRRALAEIDPTLPLGEVRTLASLVDASAGRARFVTQVLVTFAAAAVLLGAVGVYGVIAFAVARRTRELGVRAALGATPAAVRALVLGDGGRLALAGVAIGLVGAVGAGRAARAWLYGVAPAEPAVLAGVALLLGAVTLLASLLPALRAARVSPLTAMRHE